MEAIRLQDLVPQGASFKLKKTGKTYRLNAVTLSDEIWMNQVFGDRLGDIFSKIDMKEISRIIFRLMDSEDKEEFLAKEVTLINEEGEKITQRMGGAELLYLLISGFQEKVEIFEALLKTIGVSRPVLDHLKDKGEGEKKNQPTGPQSSTSSRVSTDGRRNTSSRAPRKKSRTASKRSGKG